MITIIFGQPGIGKTALNTYFALQHMERMQSWEDVKSSRDTIRLLNQGGYDFTEPNTHLVYSDYKVSYRASDCANRTSYLINGFYLGLPNNQHPVTLLPPGSHVHLTEGQRYFNSRMSRFLADFVSRYYEMHRHYGMDIYIDVQRAQLIDVNIREITGRFIEIESMKNRLDCNGVVKSSTWTVREFDSSYELEQYFSTGKSVKIGKTVKYVYRGNIFEHYNSTNCFPAFFSGCDEQSDFDYSRHIDFGYSKDGFDYYNANLGNDVPTTYYKFNGGEKK